MNREGLASISVYTGGRPPRILSSPAAAGFLYFGAADGYLYPLM
jgi:hypothetical protein